MRIMFSESQFNQNLSGWNVANVTDCSSFSGNALQWVLPKPNFTNCDPN
jgi:surface protein